MMCTEWIFNESGTIAYKNTLYNKTITLSNDRYYVEVFKGGAMYNTVISSHFTKLFYSFKPNAYSSMQEAMDSIDDFLLNYEKYKKLQAFL